MPRKTPPHCEMFRDRFAPEGLTSIRARSISRAVIYQAHHFPPETLAAEIARICAPGAKISLYGIEPCFTDRPFGRLIWKLLVPHVIDFEFDS
jgi:hypothetical protein